MYQHLPADLSRPFTPMHAYSVPHLSRIAIILACTPVMFAAQVPNQWPPLQLRHRSPATANTLRIKAGEDAALTIKVRKNEVAELVIVDPNTLLFEYKPGEVTEFNMPDFEAIAAFAKVIKADITTTTPGGITALRVPSGTAFVATIGTASVAFPGILADLKEVATGFDAISTKLSATVNNRPSDDWPSPTLETALANVGALVRFFDAIESGAAAAAAPSITLNGTATSLSDFFGKDPGKQLEWQFHARDKIRKMHAGLASFIAEYKSARAFAQNGVPVTFKDNKTLQLASDGSKGKKVAFEVAKRSGLAAVNDDIKDHQKQFSGTYHVNIEPLQSFRFRGGVGAIYSFVRNPEYSVDSSNGVHTIAEKTSSSKKLGAAATLNIYPDLWFDEPVRFFGQVGYSPLKDTQGILLGVGLNAYDKINLSGGIIYQQRNILKAGQSVGMSLTKPEDLGTRKEWKPGLYVQVSIELPTGK